MFITSKSVTSDRLALIEKFGFSKNKPNTIKKWHSTDTEDSFREHQKNQHSKKLLDQLEWTDSNVEYRFNNYGFRTDDDFDIDNQSPGIITVGCSYTEGIGINLEDTWGYKLSEKLGCKLYNLGLAGGGIETQYRLIKAWAPILKPIAVLSQGSWGYRYEFAMSDDSFFLTPWTTYFRHPSHLDFYKTVLADPICNEVMFTKTYDAIKYVLTELKIPFYEMNEATHRTGVYNFGIKDDTDYARDLSHPGKIYNSAIANYFYRFF
jgi:hypothetical protein